MPEDLTPQAPVSDPAPDPVTPETNTPADGGNEPVPVVSPEPIKADAPGDAPALGAPETYADFDLPEGVTIDQGTMDAFLPVAKELNLTQAQAQQLVSMQADMMAKIGEEQQAAWDTTIDAWQEAGRNDSEIGGTEHDAKLATARKAVNQFGTKELLEAFDATGVGSHPELIRFMYRVGKLLEDDKIVLGSASSSPKTAAEILFPNMPQE